MRILIAEDDPPSHRLLKASLRAAGHDVFSAYDGSEALEILQSEGAPQLAILDWEMPVLSGIDICRKLRAEKRPFYTYVMLVTQRPEDENLSEALHAGADDFLRKPYKNSELMARLHAGGRILGLQDELIAAREQIRREASRDALTQLLNRGAIIDTLEREVSRAARARTPLGVVMVDVDHFKEVNDLHGHDAGDLVLREVAARLQKLLRPYDAAGRYGGEEFLLVLPGCNLALASSVAERERAELANTPIQVAGAELIITASFGVAEHAPGISAPGLITAADKALYEAKTAGRNRTACAPSYGEARLAATALGEPR